MKVWVTFKETMIELIQDGLCQFCVLSGSTHIIFVSHLEYHFIKRLFLIAVADFFVVVFDTAVFAFLLGIVFSLCFIEQLMIRILDTIRALPWLPASAPSHIGFHPHNRHPSSDGTEAKPEINRRGFVRSSFPFPSFPCRW